MNFLNTCLQFLLLISPLLSDFWKFHVKDRPPEQIYSFEHIKESLSMVSQKWSNIIKDSLSKENINIVISAIFTSLFFLSPYIIFIGYIIDLFLISSSMNSILPDTFIGQTFFSLFGAQVVSLVKKSIINTWSKEAIFVRHSGHHFRTYIVYSFLLFMLSFFIIVLIFDDRNRGGVSNILILFITLSNIITYILLTSHGIIEALKAATSTTYSHKITDISARSQIEKAHNELFVLTGAENLEQVKVKKNLLHLRSSWLKFEYDIKFHEREEKLFTWGSNHILNETFKKLVDIKSHTSKTSLSLEKEPLQGMQSEISVHEPAQDDLLESDDFAKQILELYQENHSRIKLIKLIQKEKCMQLGDAGAYLEKIIKKN